MPRLNAPETSESLETSRFVQLWLMAGIGMLLLASLLMLVFTS